MTVDERSASVVALMVRQVLSAERKHKVQGGKLSSKWREETRQMIGSLKQSRFANDTEGSSNSCLTSNKMTRCTFQQHDEHEYHYPVALTTT